ncbi:MAG: LpxL/LpxP family Kdo(2)-lipid IV(A) lauroyl/palmitoleoyl acyltransferase [Halomonas sp.]|nr:LpxL/LpxP family Kdo(2)-lipid IV(A) lauroyl/palmitoleoyl acyltransferase [Halomonas sp.]
MSSSSYPRSFAHPRFWPTWVAIASMYVVAWLPWRLNIAIGSAIGRLAWRFAKRRRHITDVNIKLCFPEKSPDEQRQLVKQTFIANGIGLVETAVAWCRSPEDFRHRVACIGEENLARAQAQGKGVLIVGVHFSPLDLGGALHSLFFHSDAVYRPHNNPLFDRFMTRARLRVFDQMIHRHDLRSVIRRLKAGHSVWYSPDQDFGRDASVFAPFFGQQAATVRLTAKIARMTGAQVVPLIFYRNPDDRTYTYEWLPALEDYPSKDEVADATRINAFIEQAIRQHPEQYLWLHRRFKTRPEGEPGVY